MPFYMLQGSLKEEQMKALVDKPRNREAVAREFIESFGGKLHQYFLAFGEYDVVVIAEYPDNETASAAALKTLSTGVFSKAQTTVLMTGPEAERSMKKAHTTKTTYKPPAG
jgi:uncharacterized protein with GYD domain